MSRERDSFGIRTSLDSGILEKSVQEFGDWGGPLSRGDLLRRGAPSAPLARSDRHVAVAVRAPPARMPGPSPSPSGVSG